MGGGCGDFTDLHITCPTCVADLLFKCHVCIKCDSKYFDIVVVLYNNNNKYGLYTTYLRI